jgi:soluble lytic murein transglycosylase
MKQLILFTSIILIAQISCAQQDSTSLAFTFLNKGNCREALSYASFAKQELVGKIVATRAILDEKCASIGFEDAVSFVNQNPNWPQNDFIKKRLESLVSLNSDNARVFAWFDQNPPQTLQGFKNYAFSAPIILGQSQKTQDIIKEGWINGSFDDKEKADFLKKYAKFLNQDDHEKRIDNLLWNNNASQASIMINLIDKRRRQIYLTRIAIIERSLELEKMFHALPKKDQLSSGVLYNYLEYKKSQKKPITSQEVHLALHIPHDKKRADKWWDNVTCYYVRELIDLRKYRDAYRIASKHGCIDRALIVQAEFLAGWLSLRFLHQPKVAVNHFKAIYANSSRPLSLSRGAYWTARSYKALHNLKEANDWFSKAAKYGHTFYGQMAQIDLKFANLQLLPETKLSPEDTKSIAVQEGAQIVNLLLKYNQDHLAMAYLKSIFSNSKDPKYIAFIMNSLNDSASVSFKVNASRESALYGVFRKDYAYPAPYNIKNPLIELPLLYAIIRQESSFEQNVIDATDGRGLMQLLPSTAKKMAKDLGIAYDEGKLLNNIDYNIKLGSKHLADHINYYKGSYLLGIPAYNAGNHRVDKWIAKNGDPRKMKDLYSIVDWIEKVPFGGTRDYVQRIMENLQVYRTILNKDRSLHIVKDLMQSKSGIKNVKIASRR